MTVEPAQSLVPFLKWAGGKRWLTAQHPLLFPDGFDRYIEPFLGSGAVFFYLQPDDAILADSNLPLINTYRELRTNWQKVERILRRHHQNHSQRYYYEERDRTRIAGCEQAAQFIYLNRTCWNGLYRVNLRGKFNVPIGTKTAVTLETDDFKTVASALRNAKILNQDFEKTIDEARRGDFVFVDPPYITRHNFNGFVKYNDKIFSWDDQIRLYEAIKRAASRKVKVLMTNADHASVRRLYANVGKPISVPRRSILAADSANRGMTTELVIVINYEPEY